MYVVWKGRDHCLLQQISKYQLASGIRNATDSRMLRRLPSNQAYLALADHEGQKCLLILTHEENRWY